MSFLRTSVSVTQTIINQHSCIQCWLCMRYSLFWILWNVDWKLPTFQDNLDVFKIRSDHNSSWTAWRLKMGLIGCPKTPVTKKSTLCTIPDEQRSHLHHARSLKSCTGFVCFLSFLCNVNIYIGCCVCCEIICFTL